MIAIIDYGMGNLRSVQKAFEFLGYEAVITDSPEVIASASHVILPGVGAFEDAMHRIRETQLDKALFRAAADGKPVLGICLGMQMMFEHSDENGHFDGLGLFPGGAWPENSAHGVEYAVHPRWPPLRCGRRPLCVLRAQLLHGGRVRRMDGGHLRLRPDFHRRDLPWKRHGDAVPPGKVR